MKTLQQIIERNDYVRVNKALVARAKELAEIIKKKMFQLDLIGEDKGIHIGRVPGSNYYYVEDIESRNVGWHDYFLFARKDVQEGIVANLDGFDGYYAGDFNCEMRSASNSTYRDFLNDAGKIVEWLYFYESQTVEKMEDAIHNSEGVNA